MFHPEQRPTSFKHHKRIYVFAYPSYSSAPPSSYLTLIYYFYPQLQHHHVCNGSSAVCSFPSSRAHLNILACCHDIAMLLYHNDVARALADSSPPLVNIYLSNHIDISFNRTACLDVDLFTSRFLVCRRFGSSQPQASLNCFLIIGEADRTESPNPMSYSKLS